MQTWQILLIVVVGALCLFYLYIKILSKGGAGEFVVKLVLVFLNKNKYKKLHNITIQDNNKTIQIDHLVISKYGVFVIETKNYSGTIYGNETANHFYKYNHQKKYEFYNPIKQNYGHIFALKNVLGDYKYVSAVVFSGLATKLKVESKSYVGYIGDLSRYIKSFKEEIYTKEQITEIRNKLKSLSLKGIFLKSKHIKGIKQRMEVYDEKVEQMICPKCGSQLIERRGQYGKFLRCSSYPNCKFKKSLGENKWQIKIENWKLMLNYYKY